MKEKNSEESTSSLDTTSRRIEEIFMKHGFEVKIVNPTLEDMTSTKVRFVHHAVKRHAQPQEVAPEKPQEVAPEAPQEEKLIKDMTPEEFKAKAQKMLMEQYGYTPEKAEQAVNNPY